MFKSAVFISIAALILAGCATNSSPPDQVVVGLPMTPEASEFNWHSTNAAPVVKPAHPSAPIVRTNPPAPVMMHPAPPQPQTVLTWVSLNHWAGAEKIGAPHLISDLPVTCYAIGSSNGVLVLVIGSRDASWNGVELHLGFEPQFIDDQVFVHELDLENNLEPLLLHGSPVEFGTNRLIVIDPGHGGREAGTKSVLNNRFEKEFTMDLALRLAPLLISNGWHVVLTRTNDIDVSLSNRVAIAESCHADLFISLHFNSGAPDEKPTGLQTFCLTPPGMPSTLTRNFPDIWTQVYPNNAFNSQSVQVAMRLQTVLSRETGLDDRGVSRARFIGVLRGQRRPAVLIEAGFLSNPREARRIEDPDFRQKLAVAIADALK